MIKKRKKKTEEPKAVTKKPVSSQDQYDQLEELYKDKLPKNWDELGATAKLDWFAHRMLLDQREAIRQEFGNDAAREGGFLSDYQLERRRRREVQSKIGSWDDIPPHQGVFGRKYVDPNDLRTGSYVTISGIYGRKPEDGQKN